MSIGYKKKHSFFQQACNAVESANPPPNRLAYRFEIARHRRTFACEWSHEYDKDSRMNTSSHTDAFILESNRWITGATIGASLVEKRG